MGFRYPPEVHDFVKKWMVHLRDDELAEACNKELGTSFTADKMKSFRGNHGYFQYKKSPVTRDNEDYWKFQTRWPQGMYEYIRDNSWGVSSKEMAERVNERFGTDFTPQRMKVFRARYHIRSGETGWFRKGHEPGNKGQKFEEYCTDPEKRARSVNARFKKGNVPANKVPVGTIIVVQGRKLIKVQEDGTQWERWHSYSRHVWEQAHGEIPEGMCIIFLDGDPLNCNLENLTLAKRGEISTMNKFRYRSKDPDITAVGLTLARIRHAARNKGKGIKDES